jgi:hypothetical protein
VLGVNAILLIIFVYVVVFSLYRQEGDGKKRTDGLDICYFKAKKSTPHKKNYWVKKKNLVWLAGRRVSRSVVV